MNTLIGNNFGLVHLIAGCLALVFGMGVLVMRKGTQLHRRVGYAYVASMTLLILSSFDIYRLFGKFGIFHGLALVATFSLVAGMLPMFKKFREARDYETHFTRMYFSVVGLYMAFAAESFVRVRQLGSFWGVVAWASVVVFTVCVVVFIRTRLIWSAKFGKGRVPGNSLQVPEGKV